MWKVVIPVAALWLVGCPPANDDDSAVAGGGDDDDSAVVGDDDDSAVVGDDDDDDSAVAGGDDDDDSAVVGDDDDDSAAAGDDDDSAAAGDDDDSAAAGDDDDSAAALGLGLVQLDVEAVGVSSALLDFMGAYALLGQTTGGVSEGGCDSCGDSSGCGDCGGEGGCGSCEDAAGCNIEEELQASGCSGETSDQPNDLGCQGCRLGHGVHRVSKNHWRLVVTPDGHLSGHPGPKKHRHRGIHPATMLWILAPVILMRRRRRNSER